MTPSDLVNVSDTDAHLVLCKAIHTLIPRVLKEAEGCGTNQT